MVNRYTTVLEQDGDWWIGYAEELPGANSQGATLNEARANLQEAIRLVIEVSRELARHEVGGIDQAQAADLRARLSTFAEDWDSPEMDVYNNYDAAKANL